MGYEFRYEALLSYRQHIKEEAELRLSLARRELVRKQELRDSYQNSIQKSGEELSLGLQNRMPSHVLHHYSEYMSALEGKIVLQTMEIIRAEKHVQERLKDLLEKTRQYRIIEKLKEKDIRKWKHQELQKEQKEMSEMSVIRHGKEYI